jgi:hypothetical protein
VKKVLAILLLIILTVPITNIYAQNITSFNECYSKNAVNFLLGEQFTPYSYDLNDPKMKKVISSMCNFYHDKTGIWFDIVKDRDILNKYISEFWSQYPIKDIPDSILESFK